MTRGRTQNDRGQAVVELALALPLVMFFLLAIVQVTVVAGDALAVVHAAREGARAAAVADDPRAAALVAVGRAVRLDTGRRVTAVAVSGDLVTVTVRYRSPTDVPLVGRLVPDVNLVGRATMALEP